MGLVMMRSGIQARTFLVVLIVPFLTILVFIFLTIPREREAILNVVEAQTKGMVSAVAEINATAFVTGDYGALVDISNQVLKNNRDMRYLVVSRTEGPCFVHLQDHWEERPVSEDICRRTAGSGGLLDTNPVTHDRVYEVSYPLEFSGIPWGAIRMGISATIFDERMRNLYINMAQIAFVGVVFAMLFSYWFAQKLTKPLLQLRETTSRILQGDYSARAKVSSGDEIGMLANSFNAMTESMLASQRMSEEARAWLESVLVSMSEGLIILDQHKNVVMANRAAGVLLDQNADRIIGRPAAAMLGADLFDRITPLFRKGEPTHCLQGELVLQSEAGRMIPILYSAVCVPEIHAVVCVLRDIQERKRVELELKRLNNELEQRVAERTLEVRASELKYRILFENMAEAIFVLQNERILFWNPALQKMLKCSAGELFAVSMADLVHADDLRAFLDLMARAEAAREPVSYDGLRLQTNTSETRWVDVSCVSIQWDADRALLFFAQDVTERRMLQMQLFQAQKLEAIGTLAGGIAHDFNNILTGVLGYVSMLLVSKSPEHPDYDRLQKIEKQTDSARNLTRQLLGFSRGGKYEIKAYDLNAIVRHAIDILGRTSREIEIILSLADEGCYIDADRGQVEQVLLNLFVNATQAMPHGGELAVSTGIRELSAAEAMQDLPAGWYVEVVVRDTGIGMDETVLSHIFEPFYTTKDRGEGTGLGLASAYGIIKNHGGKIFVESEVGEGSTFRCLFPRSAITVLEQEKERQKHLTRGVGRILVIDDQEVIRSVSKEMLELLGYSVIAAASGPEGIELFAGQHEKINLVILDMIMPGMGGAETFSQLRAIDPQVPVILATGYSVDGDVDEVLSRGCNGFLQKPYHAAQLAEKISEVLSERS